MNQDIPKISIVTPSFNQSEFIEATIESVLGQNYPNLEYIIIDGGSTDKSIEIIKKYEKYLYYWCNEPDQGQYDAINKGFAHSTGEIMAWLNSDDMYYPWTFKTVSSIFSQLHEVEWLTTLQQGAWDWEGFCVGFSLVPGYSREAFLDGCYLPWNRWGKGGISWISQESTFWRRSLWEKVSSHIRTDFKIAGDFDLWSRFFLHTDLYGTPTPLGGFRIQQNQKSRQMEEYVMEGEKSLAMMRETLKWSPNLLRTMALQLKLSRLPKVREMVQSICGYEGKSISKNKLDSPDGYWEIKKDKFCW